MTAIDIQPNFFQRLPPIFLALSFCTMNKTRLCSQQNEVKHCYSWFWVIKSCIRLVERLVQIKLMILWLQISDVLENIGYCFQCWLSCNNALHNQFFAALAHRVLPILFYCQLQIPRHQHLHCLEFSPFLCFPCSQYNKLPLVCYRLYLIGLVLIWDVNYNNSLVPNRADPWIRMRFWPARAWILPNNLFLLANIAQFLSFFVSAGIFFVQFEYV